MQTLNITYPIRESSKAGTIWHPNPGNCQLDADQVHIWKIDLQFSESLQDGQSMLSRDEQERADRLIGREKRHQFVASRTALRKILSHYIKISPQNILFQYSALGKPSTFPAPSNKGIQFNLSHSDGLMILALAKHQPIGIDLERITTIENMKWIADRYLFLGSAFASLHLFDKAPEQIFFQLWILKEAFSKVEGIGFSNASKLNISKLRDMLDFEKNLPSYAEMDGYWFSSFQPQQGFIAALAVRTHKKPILNFYDYFEGNGN